MEEPESKGFESRIGPLEVNWPQTIGYYGGIALAVAFELIEPPVGVFIAAVPLLKMLSRPAAPQPVRLVSQIFEGATKPVGGDAEGTFHIVDERGHDSGHDGGGSKVTKPRSKRPAKAHANEAETAASS